MAGVKTNNVNFVSISDDVLVNRDGSTSRQKTSNLATQLAASGAIADAFEELAEKIDNISVELGPIYDDTSAGLSVVDDGVQFRVASTDADVAYDIYVRDSTNAVFVSSVPSASALAGLLNELRTRRVASASETDFSSTSFPAGTDLIVSRNKSGFVAWAMLNEEPDTIDEDIHQQDLDENWWLKIFDGEIGAGTIEPRHTRFFIASKNLFNKYSADIVAGYYVNSNNGVLTENENYSSLQFIPVEPGTEYTFFPAGQIAWYYDDTDEAYISGDVTTADNASKTLTSPTNAKYVGVSVKPAWMDDFQIEIGGSQTDYEPFGYILPDEYIAPTLKLFHGEGTIGRTRQKLRKRLRGGTAQVRIAWHMDSWGSAYNINYALIYHLLRVYDGGGGTAVGLAGPGWIGAAYVGGAAKQNVLGAAGRYTVARTGAWDDNFGTDIYSPDTCSAETTDTSATYTITSTSASNAVISEFSLLCGGTGSFDYSWDGATWTTVALTDADRQIVSLSEDAPATGDWTLYLRFPDASAFKIMGLLPETEVSGAVGHAINATGTQTAGRAASDASAFAANAALLRPDMVFLGTPINDRNAGRSVAEWVADIETLIDRWRAWSATVDLCLVMPPEVAGPNTLEPRMSLYKNAAVRLCDLKRVCLVDFAAVLGDDASAYVSAAADLPLLDAVDTHFGSEGVYLYQNTLLKIITE
ncbi:SGNH/GDSL hydrolase family protein [uncultured Celeribacter sp.]|uniref:SGNH/GDSL hydrolase family protein n=1 Tax=uncultured Celeribacter sp. TaxID=1303376 RepID=UPI002AA651A3|nr:SGNH/GDSL hydrolase family protein [uncultured Celeribacter sp.]